MRTKHIILSLIFFSQLALAQGQAGSLFLTINPGARSNAMGEAQIGVANDAYATNANADGNADAANANDGDGKGASRMGTKRDGIYEVCSTRRTICKQSAWRQD